MNLANRVPLERDVQKLVVDVYKKVGCYVFNLAQGYRPGGKRHGTTRQTKGLADLYIVPPGERGLVGAHALPWWHEVKRPGGKLRDEQEVFKALNARAGIAVVVGGLEEALQELERRGLWKRPT